MLALILCVLAALLLLALLLTPFTWLSLAQTIMDLPRRILDFFSERKRQRQDRAFNRELAKYLEKSDGNVQEPQCQK